ncbi:MAG: DEAD/DEAH box helicase, partial [Candidatus Hadarchaeales archaeon]
IERFLKIGGRCWYTTPLKALSNQKYDRFREIFGEGRVGLLTGERQENPDAQVLVATTEIFRNRLYEGKADAKIVVLDEAHYIGEEERGVTWEEIIIFSPPDVRLLLLSATIANAEEIADWMAEVRGKAPTLISVPPEERPVPLRYGMLDSSGRALPLGIRLPRRGRRLFWRFFDPVKTARMLDSLDLLPAIIFLPRRRDCDLAALSFRNVVADGRNERSGMFSELAKAYPWISNHPMAKILINGGVAPHHAGHITAWKIAVERMLAAGLVNVVFATTTLAAGLDVPARSVVLPTLWVGDKKGERPLSALEFHQMTGRAGRRGKDKVGFVLVIPHSPADIRMAEELAKSAPEELFSAFRVQYYQILNLLSGMEMKDALEVVGKSLAVFQTHRRSRKKAEVVERRLKSEFMAKATILRRLGYLDDEWKLTTIGKWAAMVRVERSLLITEALKRGLMENLTAEEMAGWAGAVVAERAPRNLVATVNLKPLAKIAFELDALEKIHGVERSNFGEAFEGGRKSSATMMAGALLRWAEGEVEWAELVRRSSAEEGDLQRGILQAAEVLHQLANLPLPVAEVAEEARIAILREPVGESPVMIETTPYPEKSSQ